MKLNWKHALVLGACVMAPGMASAHELTCDNTVDGREKLRIDSYPAKVVYKVRINNVHPDAPSVVESFRDSIRSWDYDPEPPFAIPVGGHVKDEYKLFIKDYESCLELARKDGRKDRYIDNRARVAWDLGETQCSSRIVCERPRQPPPQCDAQGRRGGKHDPECPQPPCDPETYRGGGHDEECPPPPCETQTRRGDRPEEECPPPCVPQAQGGGGQEEECPPPPCDLQQGDGPGEECPVMTIPTRPLGFYATHRDMLTQCLDGAGPFWVGALGQATNWNTLLGFLVGNPDRFPGFPIPGPARNAFEKARYNLGRQAAIAVCNARLFGVDEVNVTPVIQHALYELDAPYTCDLGYLAVLAELTEQLAEINDAGASLPLPAGFEPGAFNPILFLFAHDVTTRDGVCAEL